MIFTKSSTVQLGSKYASVLPHSVHRVWGWAFCQIFKKGCLYLAESEGGEGVKYEIFNDKKLYKQKCFSVRTKNLNWQILTKNLVTFKR